MKKDGFSRGWSGTRHAEFKKIKWIFGEEIHIPVEWKIDKIENHAKISTGSKNTQDRIKNGKFPFFIRSQKIERINSYSYDGEAVLTIGDGAIGKVFHYINGKFDFHQRVYKISDFGERLDGRFFYFYFSKNFLRRATSLSAKNTVDSIRMDMIAKMLILLPPLEEQKKIASILSNVDALITSARDVIEKTERFKRGLMQELLAKGIDHAKFKKIKWMFGEEIYIPREWAMDKIENHTKITTGSKNTQDRIENGKYPFFVRSQKIERINSYSYDGEAVLTIGDGSIGKIFHHINGKFDFHQRVYKISDFGERLDGRFFYFYFSKNFLRRATSLSAKNTVDSIRMDMIAKMLILLPPLEEQKKIASTLSGIDAYVQKNREYVNKLELLKKGLMQNLLTGKMRVKV